MHAGACVGGRSSFFGAPPRHPTDVVWLRRRYVRGWGWGSPLHPKLVPSVPQTVPQMAAHVTSLRDLPQTVPQTVPQTAPHMTAHVAGQFVGARMWECQTHQ